MDRQAAIDQILDHFENPRHYGAMDQATIIHAGRTSGCGDIVTLYVQVGAGERIVDISFEGKGCTISQAAASILTTLLLGRTLDEALILDDETLIEQMGRDIVTQRVSCATLALDVFRSGVASYRANHVHS